MELVISVEDLTRFSELRTRLMGAIGRTIKGGHQGKIYEGVFEICFPSYFDDNHIEVFSLIHEQRKQWMLKLFCYLIGPARNYEWQGETFSEVLEAAEKDIAEWITESDEFLAEEALSMVKS